LLKSIIEYQKLIEILLDDEDNLLKVFRVFGQIFFFLYWLFDNFSILCKIKLIKGNFNRLNVIASIFWMLSLCIAVPVNAIQARTNPDIDKARTHALESVRYTLDLFPATHGAKIIEKVFGREIHPLLVGFGGLTSSVISSYEVIKKSMEEK
jgi:hypothetical protein